MSTFHTGAGVALAIATTLWQARDPPAQPDTDRTSVVLEGCLQSADRAAPPPGTSPMPAFLLTGARPSEKSTRALVGTVGRTGSTRSVDGTVTVPTERDTPKTYVLVGNQDGRSAHNGHGIEVTGIIEPPDDDRGAPDAASADALRSGTERLRALLIRPVSDSCDKR